MESLVITRTGIAGLSIELKKEIDYCGVVFSVMPGLDPGIFFQRARIAGSSPAVTRDY
jgi:hypothetical protein